MAPAYSIFISHPPAYAARTAPARADPAAPDAGLPDASNWNLERSSLSL
jgi:hypothetical protein